MNAHSDFRSINMTSKGQVLIPKHVREKTGLIPGQPVRVGVNDRGEAVVVPDKGATDPMERSRQYRARVESLRGTINTGMSTNEMMRELRGDEPFI